MGGTIVLLSFETISVAFEEGTKAPHCCRRAIQQPAVDWLYWAAAGVKGETGYYLK